jgi:hypothetical protein
MWYARRTKRSTPGVRTMALGDHDRLPHSVYSFSCQALRRELPPRQRRTGGMDEARHSEPGVVVLLKVITTVA